MKTLRRPLGVSFRITGAPSDPGAVALGEFMRARHMTQLSGSAARSRWPPRQRPSSASVPDSLSAWHPCLIALVPGILSALVRRPQG